MNKWVMHCNVSGFDGVSNIRSKPTEVVEGKSESDAVKAVKKLLETRYKDYGCKFINVSIAEIRKIQHEVTS